MGYDEPEILSYAIRPFCPTSADGLHAGVRVLSYQVASALRAGTLARTLRQFEPTAWPVSLVYAGQGLLPLKLRAFLDFAMPRLKGRLAQIGE